MLNVTGNIRAKLPLRTITDGLISLSSKTNK